MADSNFSGVSYLKKFIRAGTPGAGLWDFRNKCNSVDMQIAYMLNRTQSMFKWDGLPDTIPPRILELYLQCNGNVCFYEYENNLYVFTGGLGGFPDEYYRPTQYIIANPALKLSRTLNIGKDCEIMANDALFLGLLPMFSKYATTLVENELSIYIAMINSRIIDIISAPDDRTRASADKFLKDVEDGNLGSIAENAFFDGVRAQPYGSTGNTNTITNLIELEQYTRASWFNDLGINANYNMKRESLNSAESQLNDDALLPLIDNMLTERKRGAERVNKMFGTNITVEFASAWEDNAQELDAEQNAISGQPENDELKGGDDDELRPEETD